ncbi:MAG TPA: hypothetical protein PLU35_13765 [Phycisphaerales bacterium]|nr:hypothetical protein [Phycisphaerales bacterium]
MLAIRAAVKAAKDEGGRGGLVVHRLESGDADGRSEADTEPGGLAARLAGIDRDRLLEALESGGERHLHLERAIRDGVPIERLADDDVRRLAAALRRAELRPRRATA